MSGPHGVLVVDKPRGPTSFDIVAGVRRLFGTRAVGHAGTLDPMATGVLVVLLGEATKLSNCLTGANKTYHATVTFGTATDTLDAMGEIVDAKPVPADLLDAATLDAALELERQRTEQQPPVFSAIKVGGRSAHSLARKGSPPELEPRPVKVHALESIARGPDSADCSLTVSKGYFVRSFARDLGQHLGVPAHLSALRRTASGGFTESLAQAWPMTESCPLLSLEQAVRLSLPYAELTEGGALRAKQGKPLTADDFSQAPPNADVVAWHDPSGVLVALGSTDEHGFRVKRGINAH